MKRWLLVLVAAVAMHAGQVAMAAAQETAQVEPSRTTPAPTVNVNTATPEQFEALPGVGAKMAARIVEYRDKNGPFKKVEELMNVKGIGEKNFLKLKPYLTIGAPRGEKAQGAQP
jgi:competence protein ComEA